MKLRRVFALVPDCHVVGWRYEPVWRRHFYEGLQTAGIEVILPQGVNFDWARSGHAVDARGQAKRRTTSLELSRQIERTMETGLDAVISYCCSKDLELEIVDNVRSSGIPWINFFCDSLYGFHMVKALAHRTSLNWFVERGAVARYEELGVPYLCAPYALNPRALLDASCSGAERALSFVGAGRKNRVRTVTLLRLAGVDLHVSGWGWRETLAPRPSARWSAEGAVKSVLRFAARKALHGRVGEYLDDRAFLECLRTSQTLLGLNEHGLGDGPFVGSLTLRDIEFPGLGCCYLTQHNQDVENAFEIGREVRTFRTLWEARQVARELARDSEGCRRMGQRARKRVLGEHTWSARLPQLVESLR